METMHDFRLGFLTDRNAVVRFNIPRARVTATPEQISDAMIAMMDSDVMRFNDGDPLFRHSAELVTTNRRIINAWA